MRAPAELVRFYDRNARLYQNDIRSPAWGSRRSQEERFEILSQIGNLRSRSILDVGCGLGDLYPWLRRRTAAGEYRGVDISPAMVELARRNHPRADFRVQHIAEPKPSPARPRYDYVMASGIFNRKVPHHERYVRDMVTRMFALCRRGVAFNIMSRHADFKSPSEYYADPGALLGFCLSLSRRVVLRHDYMPHDFTIYLYREEPRAKCAR